MWFKYIIIFLLFYFFVILQSSFLVHFGFLAAVPNLALILFFCLVFFEKKDNFYLLFLSVAAGIFLDIFSSAHLGTSIILLMIIGYSAKSAQVSFKENKDGRPFSYFIPLFTFSFLAYKLLMEAYFWVFISTPFSNILQATFFAEVIYNLAAASIFFYLFKRIYQ